MAEIRRGWLCRQTRGQICGDAEYLFENPETGESDIRPSSAVSRDGITFRQPVRSGAIWFYRKA